MPCIGIAVGTLKLLHSVSVTFNKGCRGILESQNDFFKYISFHMGISGVSVPSEDLSHCKSCLGNSDMIIWWRTPHLVYWKASWCFYHTPLPCPSKNKILDSPSVQASGPMSLTELNYVYTSWETAKKMLLTVKFLLKWYLGALCKKYLTPLKMH